MDERDIGDVLLPKLVQLEDEPIDPNLMAAYVAGTLPPEQEEELAARIARDPEAMMLARAMQEDARSTRTRRMGFAALAASVLIAVGLWWGGQGDDAGEDMDVDTRLLAAAERLVERQPALFEDFAPLGDDELQRGDHVTRGGLTWIAPRGVLLEPPTEWRWSGAPAGDSVGLQITGPDCEYSKILEGDRAEAEHCGAGRYVVSLTAQNGLGGQSTRAVFEIADKERAANRARAEALIRAELDGPMADLLVAHHAIRGGFLVYARSLVDKAAAGDGAVAEAAAKLRAHLDVVAPR